MKVHVITNANRGLYARELEQMHRLRHKVFVDEMKWRALASPSGVEIDEFDTEESAVYLVACEDGEVHGSLRLLPTWRRCMLKELWPEFVTRGETPTGPGIWEWTRWCPGTVTRRRELIRARGALIVASLEFARSRSIQTYITFCEAKFLGQFEELGWSPEPLGLPRAFDEGMAMGVLWHVNGTSLPAARDLLRLHEPVSIEAPAADPDSCRIRPWMLEKLLSVSMHEDAAAVDEALRRVAGSSRAGARRDLASMPMMGSA